MYTKNRLITGLNVGNCDTEYVWNYYTVESIIGDAAAIKKEVALVFWV